MPTLSDAVLAAGVFGLALLLYRKMPRNGNLLFKIQYFLYTKTPIGYLYYRREVNKSIQKFGRIGHSHVMPVTTNGLTILPLVMSLDNYGYLITDEVNKISVLVDPADPEAVQRVLNERKTPVPVAILTTHKHWDHSAGNKEWKKKFPSIEIYGGKRENIPAVTHPVSDGDRLTFGRLQVTVYETPGHTLGHVVYLVDGSQLGAPSNLFSGDHLFIGGIGRIFEGSGSMMLRSLDRLSHLPDDVLLWPGHEYSLANLEFAAQLEPNNATVQEKFRHFAQLRKSRRPTCPSTMGEEKQYNPFLRTGDVSLQNAVGLANVGLSSDELRVQVLLQCRARKDAFVATG